LGAITRRMREGKATRGETLERCEKWLRYLDDGTVSLVPEGAVLDEAIELSMTLKHPLPDCLYLAAAGQLKARLVTADRPLFKQAKGTFKQIEMLPGGEVN